MKQGFVNMVVEDNDKKLGIYITGTREYVVPPQDGGEATIKK